MIIIRKFLVILLISMFSLCGKVYADDCSIVAVVDDEAITTHALESRVEFIINSSHLENTKEIQASVMSQALQGMINEMLRKHAAKNLGIKVSKDDMSEAIADLEKKNKLESGGFDDFIKSQNISKKILMAQIESQILWKKIVSRKIHPQIVISDYEIDEVVSQLTTDANEVYISEILLPIAKSMEKEALDLANRLVTQLRNGDSSFSSLAEQFSTSSSATNGGAIGWISEENLGEEIKKKIITAKAHEILNPILTKYGYRIIKIGNKRKRNLSNDVDRIRQLLSAQKLELESRRYMKNLRSNAFIEIRL